MRTNDNRRTEDENTGRRNGHQQQWQSRGREREREREDDRGFVERAGDEVRSWFGDEEAARRRQMDEQQRSYYEESMGRGRMGDPSLHGPGGQWQQYGQPGMGQYGHGQWQPQYGQSQYGQPQYGQSQYGQPQYGQSQYGQPQYGQPQYGQGVMGGQYGGHFGGQGVMGGQFGGHQGVMGGQYGGQFGGNVQPSYGQGYGQNYGQGYGQNYGYGQGPQFRGTEDLPQRGGGIRGRLEEWKSGGKMGERGRFLGRGPKGYQRSDDRINEEICELLTRNPDVDASEIQIKVNNGEVILTGTVDDRDTKRMVEDLVEDISGVREVQNQLRIHKAGLSGGMQGKSGMELEGQQGQQGPGAIQTGPMDKTKGKTSSAS